MEREYQYPVNLFTEVRIENRWTAVYVVQNGEVMRNLETETTGAIVRVYDGQMWYTSVTNAMEDIQKEIDGLAALATPNPEIYEHPTVRNFGDCRDTVLRYQGEDSLRKVSEEEREKLVWDYVKVCEDNPIPEVASYRAILNLENLKKEYYSSKGAAICQDQQSALFFHVSGILIDGVTTGAAKGYSVTSFAELKGHEEEILAERERYLRYAKEAVDVKPGDYTCVLAPSVTAMFTHESFGHKSESDFMLNDKTLREEWILGKKVGSELVSISDDGALPYSGYVPYDDEGNRAVRTDLITKGVLTGRLHDSHSAAVLGETITGNARAQSYYFSPVVRMTNTIMAAGESDPEDIIAGVQDGVYIYGVNYGTGSATFTLQPNCCYRIRDGKLCEPLRVNVVTGSVFEALFDVDAVGNDLRIINEGVCGKNGQSVNVSMGGPTIRVKKLSVN